jgi:hypothetical protein
MARSKAKLAQQQELQAAKISSLESAMNKSPLKMRSST